MSDYRDHFDVEIERAARKITETGARVSAHRARSGPVTGKVSSTDGAITVTVAPGGNLLDIEIENSGLAMPPEELAAELVRLAGKATRDANARMHSSLRSVVDPEVARGLTELGIHPDTGDDEVDWAGVLRRPL